MFIRDSIEAACRDYGIHVSASVEKVEVDGLAVRRTRSDCVRVDPFTNQGVTISDGMMLGCGASGISVKKGGGPVRIIDNEISDPRDTGIALRQTAAPLVQGNYVHDVGVHAYDDDFLSTGGNYQGTGILLIDGGGALITENRIDKTAYGGILVINFGGPSSNRTISFNHVKDAMLGLNDGAGIYFHVNSNSSPPRNKISHNIVENCIGSYLGQTKGSGYYPQGVGIYIDNGTDTGYVDIEYNTIAHNYTNLFLHDTHENSLVGNVLYADVVEYGRSNLSIKSTCIYAQQNNVLNGNTLFSVDSSIVALRLWRNGDCLYLKASDNNRFGFPGSAGYIRNELYPVETKLYDLSQWQAASGLDAKSTKLPECSAPTLLSNPSLQTVSCTSLNGCKDVVGAEVSAPVSIKPFDSLILCGCKVKPVCGP